MMRDARQLRRVGRSMGQVQKSSNDQSVDDAKTPWANHVRLGPQLHDHSAALGTSRGLAITVDRRFLVPLPPRGGDRYQPAIIHTWTTQYCCIVSPSVFYHTETLAQLVVGSQGIIRECTPITQLLGHYCRKTPGRGTRPCHV